MGTNVFLDVFCFAAVAESPTVKSASREKLITLCEKLIAEEAQETADALELYKRSGSLEHLAEAVDGAVDTIYVCAFFLNQMELDAQAHWNLVQERNMAKFPGGVAIKNEFGKVQKPEGWTAPDHLPLLMDWASRMRGQVYVSGWMQQSSPIEGGKV